jgi:endogenous inhibitor of DNA gyrase (YacG/DUF329 family)
MRTSQTTTTLTCDKCNQVVSHLNSIYENDTRPSPFQSSMCHHIQLGDLCNSCFSGLLNHLGPIAKSREERIAQEKISYPRGF